MESPARKQIIIVWAKRLSPMASGWMRRVNNKDNKTIVGDIVIISEIQRIV